MKNKLIALLLSFTFIFTLIPLNALAESAIINEGYTVEESTITKDGLVLNKTANYNTKDGTVDITLEAYTTGVVKETTNTEPLDIVMVLDRTGSLGDETKKNPQNDNEIELDVVKSSAKSFLDAMVNTGADHRVSVIWFNSGVEWNCPFKNLRNSDGTENQSNIAYVAGKISNRNVNAYGWTGTSSGIDAAITRIAKENSNRKKVVVVFTDGVAGHYSYWYENATGSYNSRSEANKALAKTKVLKETYGAEVYVISFLNFDNKDLGNTESRDSELKAKVNWCEKNNKVDGKVDYTPAENLLKERFENTKPLAAAFMNYMSSNYGAEDTMPDTETAIANFSGADAYNKGNYVINVTDIADLNNAFTTIAQTIYPTYPLDDEVSITDTLSQYFENASNVRVYQQAFKDGTVANPNWHEKTDITSDVKVDIENDSKTVTVTGFDFDENCVVPDATNKGAKLVIEFSAVPIKGFVGGNKVQTNNPATSGIKVGDELIATFPLPAVDIPMKYSFKTNDKSIYVTDEVALSDLVDLKALSGLINDFVNVEIVITDKNGNVVGKATNTHDGDEIVWDEELNSVRPTKTTEYKVSCTISPRYDDTNSTNYSKQKFESIANVYVYIPKINQYNDAVDKGTEVDLDTYVSVVDWECDEECAKPTGATPNFTFEYKKVEPATAAEVGDNKDNYQMDVTTRFNVVGMTANGMNIIDLVDGFNTTEQKENKQFTISVIEPEITTKEPETTTEAPTTTKPTTTQPVTTTQETTTIVIEDETPQAPETTTQPTTTKPVIIIEDETPLATVPSTTAPAKKPSKKPAPGTIVIEDETPLGSIPHTADASEPMKWAAIMAVAPVAIAFIKKSKEELEDETN